MPEIINLLSKVGIPGLILSFVVVLFKSGPITLFTSTAIERKILSKEKKTIIVIGEYLIKSVAITIFYTGITFGFLNNEKLYNEIVMIVGLVILIIFFMFILIYTGVLNKNIFDLHRNKSKKLKRIIVIAFLVLILICFLLIPYMIGTQAVPYFETYISKESMTTPKEYNLNELLTIVTSTTLIYLFFSVFCVLPVASMVNAFLGVNDKENEKLYFEEVIKGENDPTIKWYIYHSTNSKMLFIGNNHNPKMSDQFKFIPIEEVYKKVLIIEKQKK